MTQAVEASWGSEEFRANDTTLLDAMQRTFEFLVTDFGYELVSRTPHFRDHYLVYAGRDLRVIVSFNPENSNGVVDLYVAGDLAPGKHVRATTMAQLLSVLSPDRSWEVADHPPPYSFTELESAYERWAEGLRTILAGTLRGEGLDSISWGRAW
jgi:hypothetical protein